MRFVLFLTFFCTFVEDGTDNNGEVIENGEKQRAPQYFRPGRFKRSGYGGGAGKRNRSQQNNPSGDNGNAADSSSDENGQQQQQQQQRGWGGGGGGNGGRRFFRRNFRGMPRGGPGRRPPRNSENQDGENGGGGSGGGGIGDDGNSRGAPKQRGPRRFRLRRNQKKKAPNTNGVQQVNQHKNIYFPTFFYNNFHSISRMVVIKFRTPLPKALLKVSQNNKTCILF